MNEDFKVGDSVLVNAVVTEVLTGADNGKIYYCLEIEGIETSGGVPYEDVQKVF